MLLGEDDVEGGVPRAVRGSIAQELDRLAPSTRALLEGAAVLGERFEPDVAAEVAQQGAPAALAALDELTACGLVHATDTRGVSPSAIRSCVGRHTTPSVAG